MTSYDLRQTLANITPLNEHVARELLSDALHNYITTCLNQQDGLITPSHFACLIMCQYACAERYGDQCISRSLTENGEARVLQGAVTLGRLLNAERKIKC